MGTWKIGELRSRYPTSTGKELAAKMEFKEKRKSGFHSRLSMMKARRKKRPHKNRRRGIYVLPNLITSAGLFGGFFSIISTIQERYEAAAIAVIISAVFDSMDGRIARLTHTTSHFGTEYDSLSDLVAFGLAPGILAFQWALAPFGRLGWLAAFVYVACGALRLARFNVQRSVQDPNYFRGLPIPGAACFIASLVLFFSDFSEPIQGKAAIILTTVFTLAFLMVSTLPFYSFKRFDIRKRKPFGVLVSVILLFVIIAHDPTIMFFLIVLFYVLSGPVVTFYRLYRKRPLARGPSLEPQPGSEENSQEGPSKL